MNQSELKANTCNRRQARENACEQVVIDLSYNFWLVEKVGRDFLTNDKAESSKTKTKQSKTRITFDTQLKTAL